ncbi:MAG: PKD domain-containing protein [Micrococcales bacterium]|nr:PKD domain-containing protein [Micrococcales bacterium]
MPAAAALVAAGLWAVPATAVPLAAEPAPVSVDALPTVQVDKGASGRDGAVVWSQAVVGNTVYVGGDFTVARPAGSKRGTDEVTRTHLLAYDITTGKLITSFNHTLDGQVRGVAASPDGSRVYITGDFTQVDGQWRVHLAAFSTADGSLVAGFRPVLASAGLAVAASSSTVYVGGNFTKVGQTAGGPLVDRGYLAAFAADDGAVRDFRADANDPVTALAVTAAGDRLVVGGRFTSLAGTGFYGLGSLDPTTGAAQPFPVNNVIRTAGAHAGITSLYADATGIYGTGYDYAAGRTGNLEGTFRADPGSGDLLWVADCYGDTYSVVQAGGVVYDASHHHDCASTPGGFPETRPRSYHHGGAYTVEATGTDSGPRGYAWSHKGRPAPTMLAWYPEFMTGKYTGAGQGPWSVAGNSQYISYGGEFQAVNSNKIQQGLVRFAAPEPVQTQDVTATYASVTDGVVTATVSTGWGRDGETLTYRLYRGPADAAGLVPADASLVASQDATRAAGSTVTLTDSTARPGTTASYLVTVSDSDGGTVPTGGALTAAWQQVKVAGVYRNAEPVASFTTTTDGLRVTVDGTASTDDSAVASYSWSFGDQTAAVTGATASHTYASAGAYQVTLTVTDDEGAVGTTTRQVTVTAGAARQDPDPGGQGPTPAGAPVAWYESTVSGMQVNLDGSGSCDCDSEIVSYQWEFGDGTTGAGVTATHTYVRAGTYRVVLIVTNNKGLVSAVYSDIVVQP